MHQPRVHPKASILRLLSPRTRSAHPTGTSAVRPLHRRSSGSSRPHRRIQRNTSDTPNRSGRGPAGPDSEQSHRGFCCSGMDTGRRSSDGTSSNRRHLRRDCRHRERPVRPYGLQTCTLADGLRKAREQIYNTRMCHRLYPVPSRCSSSLCSCLRYRGNGRKNQVCEVTRGPPWQE